MNKTEPLVIDFSEERFHTPSASYLRAHVQGQIVFIGQHWMYESEARALRDWLNKVLPTDACKPGEHSYQDVPVCVHCGDQP